MKRALAQNLRGPLRVALLVFLVVLTPLIWLFVKLRDEAATRDMARLDELRAATRKLLTNDSTKHQQLMQTWRKRVTSSGIPQDAAAWELLFDGPESLRLGRFRSVGMAQWEEGGRLIVRFGKGQDTDEPISNDTDLSRWPKILAALEAEKSVMRGMVVGAGSIEISPMRKRTIALTSLQPDDKEGAVVFTTTVTEDFLTPTLTVWNRTGTQGGVGDEHVQKDQLPGVSEGMVTIKSVEPSGPVHPEFQWSSVFGDLNLNFQPGPKFARDSLSDEPWIVLIGGTSIALLLATLAWMQARQHRTLQHQVRTKTADLLEANAALNCYKAIIETTSDLVGLCEMDGTPIFMNRAGRHLLGIGSEESLAAFPFERILAPENLELFAQKGIPHAMEHGSWSAEIQMIHGDGHEIPVSFEGVVIRAATGDETNLGCIARDITASRQLDVQLRASLDQERELVALKSQFVNTVSHEFRTPLGVILSSADILRCYLDRLTDETRHLHLTDISESCKQMSRMLEQVLDLGGIEMTGVSCRYDPIDLAGLLSRIIDESRSATQGGEVVLKVGPDLVGATGDEALLRHIFLNLISNSLKYSSPDAEADFEVERKGGNALFTLRDRGIGIPQADVPRLFESFLRGSNVSNTPGTGLGLAIVKRSTTLHGGIISIESELGRGTLVTVCLPLFSLSL